MMSRYNPRPSLQDHLSVLNLYLKATHVVLEDALGDIHYSHSKVLAPKDVQRRSQQELQTDGGPLEDFSIRLAQVSRTNGMLASEAPSPPPGLLGKCSRQKAQALSLVRYISYMAQLVEMIFHSTNAIFSAVGEPSSNASLFFSSACSF